MVSFRTLLRNGVVVEAVSWIASLYLRVVWLTGRWTIENREIADRLVAARRPFIICFWHSRLLMLPFAWTYTPRLSIVISHHRDGRFIARTVGRIGIGTIAGSSSRGGGAALRAMVRTLDGGDYVGISPDGPRGPRMRASVGAVRAARLAGAVMLPATYGVSRRRVLNSWDRFIVPLPFARGIIRAGEPVTITRDADDDAIEQARLLLEARLNEITRDVDARLGLAPVEPASEAANDRVAGKPALRGPSKLHTAGER